MGSAAHSPPLIWLGFLVLGAMNLGDGLVMAIFGAEALQGTIEEQVGTSWSELSSSNPTLAQYVNTLTIIIGLLMTGYALFIVVVSVTGYKRGHKWAWYAMWNPTLFYLMIAILFFVKGDIFTSDALSPEFVLVMVLGTTLFQLMGYPRFFREAASPKETMRSASERVETKE